MRDIKSIIFHHSATPQSQTLEKSVASFNRSHRARRHPNPNGYGLHVAYHFVIGEHGKLEKTRPLAEVGYHAWDWKTNQESVWICFVWNFQKEHPTAEQYATAIKLVEELQGGFPSLKLFKHNQVKKWTSCPGVHFNLQVIKEWLSKEKRSDPIHDKQYLSELKALEYHLSAFRGQTKKSPLRKECNLLAEMIREEQKDYSQ